MVAVEDRSNHAAPPALHADEPLSIRQAALVWVASALAGWLSVVALAWLLKWAL